jgi:hypothetical protein
MSSCTELAKFTVMASAEPLMKDYVRCGRMRNLADSSDKERLYRYPMQLL